MAKNRPSIYTDEILEAIDRWSGVSEAPNAWSRQYPRGLQIMQSKWGERLLGTAHPITPGIWFGPTILYGLYRGFSRGEWLATLGLFLAGWLIWTLLEYLLHRFLFHYVAHSAWGKRQLFFTHGYHHEFPNDGSRLVAPIWMSWPPAIAVALAYYGVLGPDYWAQIFAGTTAGYLAYDWVHYYTHHFTPRNRVGKWLRKYHMLHHYKDGNVRFGISNPLWDVVFGTFRSTSERVPKGDAEMVAKTPAAEPDKPLQPAQSPHA